MKKPYQLFSILFFFLFLCLPIVKHIYLGDKVTSKENRALTQKPPLPTDFVSLVSYSSKLDDYLSDQFGFRNAFIKTANRLRYALFNETTSKQITIGKNGYIFLNSHGAKYPYSLINKVCDIIPVKKEAQDEAILTFSNFINNYEEQGYMTGIAIIPTKSRIYPEQLLNSQATLCQRNKNTWLDVRINEIKGRGAYYPLKKLRQWKAEFSVYLKYYFHWNGELPYYVADDMMRNYWNIEPDFEVNATEYMVKSDLRKFLHGLDLWEKSKHYNYNNFKIKECKDRNCFKRLHQSYKQISGFRFNRTKPTTLRRLLILSDSFGFNISEHFIRGFDEVALISITNLALSEQKLFYQTVLDDINPTHLLLLFNDSGFVGNALKIKKLLVQL